MNRIHVSLLLACLWVSGCKQEESEAQARFAVEFSAVDDAAAPVEGTRFLLGSKELWRSDAGGRAVLQLRGQEGQELAFSVECPEGHRLETPPGKLRLSQVRTLGADTVKPLGFRAQCQRLTKDVVLVVRAERGKGTIVRVPGSPDIPLDESGTAHVPLTLARAEKTILVGFDTRNVPRLSPKNPERSLELPEGDGLVLLSQEFSLAKATTSSKKSGVSPRHVPYRIQ